jgi:hypothetical protein
MTINLLCRLRAGETMGAVPMVRIMGHGCGGRGWD